MKSLAEFYPDSAEANFYAFLEKNELEELTKSLLQEIFICLINHSKNSFLN